MPKSGLKLMLGRSLPDAIWKPAIGAEGGSREARHENALNSEENR